MSKPIKAFLGKRYTKNGVTKAYMYNPEKDSYGFYNVGEHMTDAGMFQISEDAVDSAKAQQLRTNIITVIRTIISESLGNNIEGMDKLFEKMRDELNSMSDYEIEQFANNNKKHINLYFEYKDVGDTGMDARVLKLAEALGINIYDYIENEDIPEEVQTTLTNIEDYVNLRNEFEDLDEDVGMSSDLLMIDWLLDRKKSFRKKKE